MKDKGLQKFTPKQKAIQLLKQPKITVEELNDLSKKELDTFFALATDKLNSLTGSERDKFISWAENVMSDNTKNEIWEYNHERISWGISALISELGRMPTKTELAEKTGLSRQTIHKHLNSFSDHHLYREHLLQLRILGVRVLSSVYQVARNGDTAAAKLFLSSIGMLNERPAQTQVDNQNNFIQINNLHLDQKTLAGMPIEVIKQVEEILKGHLQ